MKRFLTILAVAILAIGSASAQKKIVDALSTEVATLKQQIAEANVREDKLQQQCNELSKSLETMDAKCKSMSESLDKLNAQLVTLTDLISKMASSGARVDPNKPKYEIVGELANGLVVVKEGFLYGYVNAKGEYVIPAQYEYADSFENNYAFVKKSDKWGVIAPDGKELVACNYDEVTYCDGTIYKVKIGDKWGILKSNGEYLLPCVYDRITRMDDGLFEVSKGNKWGVANATGKEVIACTYDNVRRFGRGSSIWIVEKYGLAGLISSTNGAVIQPIKYSAIHHVGNNRAAMQINTLWGFFDQNGKIVIQPKFRDVGGFDSAGLAYAEAVGGGRPFYIDKNGNVVRYL